MSNRAEVPVQRSHELAAVSVAELLGDVEIGLVRRVLIALAMPCHTLGDVVSSAGSRRATRMLPGEDTL